MSINFQKREPINIYSERLKYINLTYNYLLNQSFTELSNNNKQPAIKLGFIGDASSESERLFVAQDSPQLILMIRKTKLETDKEKKIKSVYFIVRSLVKYIHFSTGYIIKDIFDYFSLEIEEMFSNVYFIHYIPQFDSYGNFIQYNTTQYTDIREIMKIDENYKTTTTVHLIYNNFKIEDIYTYSYIYMQIVERKIGYYVPVESYKCFHPHINISENFGNLSNEELQYQYQSLLFSDQYLVNFINLKMVSNYNSINIKQKITTISLNDKISGIPNNEEQEKRVVISWFLIDVLYNFIFGFSS